MVDVGIPEPAIVETIEELGGSLTAADHSCLDQQGAPSAVVEAARRVIADPTGAAAGQDGSAVPRAAVGLPATRPAAPAAQSATTYAHGRSSGEIVVRVAPCLVSSGPLSRSESHAFTIRSALRHGHLAEAVSACNAYASLMHGWADQPPATPMEEDQRTRARKEWLELCHQPGSGTYARATLCAREAIDAIGALNLGEPGEVAKRMVASHVVEHLAPLLGGLEEAEAAFLLGDGIVLPDPISGLVAWLQVDPGEAPINSSYDSIRRAQEFRQAIFERRWSDAIRLINEEQLFGAHPAEAGILAALLAHRPPPAAALAALEEEPWGDMGLVRSRARLPWLYAADAIANRCGSVTLPEGKGPDYFLALLATLPTAEATLGCFDTALRYATAAPVRGVLADFEKAAGFDRPAPLGRRDRLSSTAQMATQALEKTAGEVRLAEETARKGIELARAKLPPKIVKRIEKARAKPVTRCAEATGMAELRRLQLTRFEEAAAQVRKMMEEIHWWDEDLDRMLTVDALATRDALAEAESTRNEVCLAAGRKVVRDGL